MQSETTRQITKNCHYISRFLTRPWEFGQRQLHYYDFEADSFETLSSRNLFAEDEINTPEVETWLRDVVETPLGAVRPRLAAGDPAALDDWRFYRAALLMLWLQGVRVRSIAEQDARLELGALAALPQDQLDGLVAAIRAAYDLQLVFTIGRGTEIAPLFVPSAGLFQFTFPDTGCLSGHAMGIGLPLDQRCALVATPVEQHGRLDQSRLPGSVANCSVGTSASRRVVFSPDILSATSKENLRQVLQELRRANDFLVSAVREAQELVMGAFAQVGLQADREGSGRVRPPKL